MALKKSRLPHSVPSLFNLLDKTPLLGTIRLLHEMQDEQVERFFKAWSKTKFSVIDLETAGHETGADALNPFQGYVRLYQICWQGKAVIVDSLKTPKDLFDKFIAELKSNCENPNLIQVYHNGIFDLNWLRIQHGIRSKGVRDTMIMSKMLYAGVGRLVSHSLGGCVKRHLGVELDKSAQKDDWSVYKLSNSQLNYAANDVIYTEKLFYELVKECRKVPSIDMFGRSTERSFVDVVITECNAIPAFSEIVATGQPIDLDYARDVLRQYNEAIEDLYAPVFSKLGLPHSAQSAKLHAAIKSQYGVAVKDLPGFDQEEGEDTTSAKALFLTYCDSGIEDLMRISLARTLAKTITTLEKLIKSAEQCGGYARGNYTSLGDTSSGRSTCKGKDKKSSWECLNLQNIPNHTTHPLLDKYNLPKIRSIITHKGYEKKMALYDLSSSHARYAAKANLSNDFSLVEVLNLPDPHSYLTLKLAKLAGKDWDLDYYNANKKTDSDLITMRSVAKTCLY